MTRPHEASRAIRVFVSSTFRDMQAEREELVKRVFPQLRKLCESRGVTWGEVDLRWGVTDEQKAEGQVLPICLAEIALSRPYFIGLLGERYGWVPDELSAALIEREPWLASMAGRSVTELEILHGVLNNPEMAEHAYFYFRDPAYVETLPADIRHAFVDGEEPSGRLRALKQRVRESGLPVREPYRDPRALADLVLEDLRKVIDRLYPAGSVPDALEREAAEHEAFIESRARLYLGRDEYFRALDAYVPAHEPNLAVIGESGSGKSALLANWVRRRRETNPYEVLIPHFIGASAASTSVPATQRRIISALNRTLGLDVDIPDSPDALQIAFAESLSRASHRPVTLVFDAFDQLEDTGSALDLGWLPSPLHHNIRIICSTLPGRPLEALRARGFAEFRLQPLNGVEQLELITAHLAQYRKALSSERARRIVQAPQSGNPLFLRALLEELRLWGDHLTLDRRIDELLGAATIGELYQKILERWEADYERDRPGLVRDAMSLIWASRRGLSEAELLDLLGTHGEPLPQASWSPLFLAAEPSLVIRSGLIGFFHQYLHNAVRDRYLPDDAAANRAHLRLADYFAARETNPRKLDELPWQLARTQSWQRLYDLLADLPFFTDAWHANDDDMNVYWAQVERESPLRRVDAYRGIIESPNGHLTRHAFAVGQLLAHSGYLREAQAIREMLVAYYRHTKNAADLELAVAELAYSLFRRGDVDAALPLYEELEALSRSSGNTRRLVRALSGRAGVLTQRGQLQNALELHEQAEALCRETGDKSGLQFSLGNQAGVLFRMLDVDRASQRIEEKERLCRELGAKSELATCLTFRGAILEHRKEFDRAIDVLQEAQRVYLELGVKEGVHMTFGLQAVVHKKRKNYDAAIACFREKARICREMDDMASLAVALANEASVLLLAKSPKEALARVEEATRIAEARGLTLLVDRFRSVLERAKAAAIR